MNAGQAEHRDSLPHSAEAEQSVLGALLLDNGAWRCVTGLVGADDFYLHQHRQIFAAVANMVAAGQPADVITVFEHLQRHGEADDCGGLKYLNDLAQSVPSATNIGRYAEIVHERSVARRGLALGQELKEALSQPGDPCITLARFSDRLAQAGAARVRPTFTEVDLGQLGQVAPRQQRWFWDGYLPAGHVTLLGGHGGAGKSTVALMLAGSLATGRDFLGTGTTPANVLFYSAEDPEDLVLLRLASVCRHMNLDPQQIRQRLRVIDATDLDPVLFAERRIDGSRIGQTTHAYEALRDFIAANEIDVLIVDNSSDVFDGDEINRSMVRGFMRSLAQLVRPRNGAVLLLAHVDKSTSRAARAASAESYSGSTAWHNSARSRLFLLETEPGMLELQHQKCNLGPKRPALALRWPQDGLPTLDAAPSGIVAAIAQDNDTKALLRLIAGRKDWISTATSGPATAVQALRDADGYPKRLSSGQVFELLRNAEHRGWLERVTYENAQRKPRERWQVTGSGLTAAQVAQVAQFSVTGATGALAEPAAQVAQVPAPGGVGGMNCAGPAPLLATEEVF